jgi:hypothetical protein
MNLSTLPGKSGDDIVIDDDEGEEQGEDGTGIEADPADKPIAAAPADVEAYPVAEMIPLTEVLAATQL